jgi:hypothetical protein
MKKMMRRRAAQPTMMGTAVGNLVGMGMLGATAGMAGGLPAGSMAANMANLTTGLQATSMIGPNLQMVNASMGAVPRRRVARRRR